MMHPRHRSSLKPAKFLACGVRFWRNAAGGLAVIFALTAPVLLGVAGLAIDYATASSMRTTMQSMTDSAAIAGAKEFSLASSTGETVSAVVAAHVGRMNQEGTGDFSHTIAIDMKSNEVRVEIQR